MFTIKRLLICSLLIPCAAYACIGQSVRVAIIGIGESAVIQRFVFDEQKEDLLDDTGYIGAHVLIADILNSSKDTIVESQQQKIKISALKERLSLLLKKLGGFLANKEYQVTEPGMYKNVEDAVNNIKKLKEIVDSNPSRSEIDKIWKSIEAKLNSTESSDTNVISSKYRKPGTKEWSQEEDLLTDFKLPIVSSSKALTRSVGCENEMLEVNLSNNLQRSTAVEPISLKTNSKKTQQSNGVD